MINIGIMGFGRIGRDIYSLASNHKDFNITAIGDVADPKILQYLLVSESHILIILPTPPQCGELHSSGL